MTPIEKLKTCSHRQQGSVGKAPANWARTIGADRKECEGLSDRAVDRTYLYDLIAREVDHEKPFLSVMAWGGMRADHGRIAWEARSLWLPILTSAFSGNASRQDLYRAFNEADIPGLKPAFFTKLIHFSRQRGSQTGYIMDQWTAKSVNLICGNIVEVWPSGWVPPTNDHLVYETFCKKIEEIAEILGTNGSQAEERLFSRGGPHRGEWRQYVIENYTIGVPSSA